MQINDVYTFSEFCLYMTGVSLGVEIEFCRNLLAPKKNRKEKKEISVERYELRILCVAVPVTSLRLWDTR